MSRETKVPQIPAITKDNVTEVLQAIKDILEVREGARGDALDENATFRDLLALRLVESGGSISRASVGGNGSVPVLPPGSSADGYDPNADLTTPPPPTNLIARPGISDVLLFWDNATYKNHSYTEIWRSETDALGDAVKIGTTSAFSYSDAVQEGRTYYYWVRFVSMANVIGPYNQTSGTIAITELSPDRLLNLLTGQITESQLYQTLGSRINLIDDPATGLVRKVSDLEDIVGDTADAAEYAAAAAQSASQAVAAQAAALLAQQGAESASSTAVAASTSASTSAANASTSATQASQSATGAAGSAATASQSATTATNAANAAGGSASSAATSASNAASYATAAETASTAATSAKVSAEAARDQASGSASAAATSASTATAKATEASQSASSAQTSATNASTSAGNASTSATQASNSATSASGSASSASNSATAAANSATAAGNSASAASTSASNAATSATSSGNSATAAQVAKVAAESARDNAASSATAAASSASTAATEATNAGQSATSAQQSATTASTASGNALTYRDQASTSATNAAGSASSASTSAGAAAISAANAQSSANAASSSASTASTKATEAAASASSATTSSNSASTSASNALTYSNNAATASSNAQGYSNSAALSAQSAASSLNQIQSVASGFDAAFAWNFDSNTESWAAVNAAISASGGVVRLTPSSGDAILYSPNSLSLNGTLNTLVRARVKRISGSGWDGQVFYFTNGHGESSSYRKAIADTTVIGEWRVLEWDMAALTAGGNDWTTNTINRIRIDLGTTVSDVFDIDWIAIGRTAPQAYSVAIAQEATTRAAADGTLFGQYTVKIDSNGYVTGYGLASTATNATPTSEFAVRADRFYVSSPTGPGITPAIPFVVQTTPTTINGETVPVGVYLDTAYIKKGTITSAYIGDLNAGKITAGTISAAVTMTTPTLKSGNNYNFGSSGFFIGYDGSTPKLYIGNGSDRYLKWDGTQATISGLIYAGGGQIGGINILGGGIASANYIDGSAGFTMNSEGYAQFNNVSVRGNVVATSGSIGGNVIDTTGLRSSNYLAGNAGWRINSSGSAEFRNIIARGDIEASTLKANTVMVETLNINGNAVTVPFFSNSAGGTFTPSAAFSFDTSSQNLVAGTLLMVTAVAEINNVAFGGGFKGAAMQIIMYGPSNALVCRTGISYNNYGVIVTSGGVLIPTTGSYYLHIDVYTTDASSGTVTSVAVSGFGGKR